MTSSAFVLFVFVYVVFVVYVVLALYGAEVDAVACCGACGACCCPEPAMVVDGLDAVWCVEYERSLVFQRGIITLYCVFLWPKRDEYVSIADTDGVLLHIHTGEAETASQYIRH